MAEQRSALTCPTCGTKLEVLLFLGIQPDGYVCPTCQIYGSVANFDSVPQLL